MAGGPDVRDRAEVEDPVVEYLVPRKQAAGVGLHCMNDRRAGNGKADEGQLRSDDERQTEMVESA